jgi:hypothetical protein
MPEQLIFLGNQYPRNTAHSPPIVLAVTEYISKHQKWQPHINRKLSGKGMLVKLSTKSSLLQENCGALIKGHEILLNVGSKVFVWMEDALIQNQSRRVHLTEKSSLALGTTHNLT